MSKTTETSAQTRLKVNSPADVLAVVPYLIGFHPSDSLVVMGIGGRRFEVRFTARMDLPSLDESDDDNLGDYVADMVAAQPVREVILVAYGQEAVAVYALESAIDALEDDNISVREALRVHDGRYWSHVCEHPSCCPPEGTPYDVTSSEVAAAATLAGHVALPDRATLERSIAPLGGVARASMQQATNRAEERFTSWADEDTDTLRQRMADEGSMQVRQALDRYQDGEVLSDDETAWLCLLLTHLQVRDEAWLLIDEDNRDAHIALWTHLVRRADVAYVAAPACLLAFAAWQSGNGALASIAVDRALWAEPDYSMAILIADLLQRHIPPSSWQPRLTPEELSDLYARRDYGKKGSRGPGSMPPTPRPAP